MRIARCVRQHRIGPIALFIDRRPPVAHRARDAREPVTTDRATRTERRAARSVRVRRRQRRFGALLGVVSLACGGALLASAAEPSEALAASWSTGVEASLPAGAGSSPDVEITSVSCASAGECSAVGNYTDGSDHQQGLLLSESGGTWSAGVEATLPAGAGSEPGVHLPSVSCASAGNCSAVGYYIDSSENRQGLLLSESGGTWSTGVKATLPGDAGSDPHVSLYSVSCALAGDCSAVGNYFDVGDADSSGYQQGLLLSESGGTWSTGVKAIAAGRSRRRPGRPLREPLLRVVCLGRRLQRRRQLRRQLGLSAGVAAERERGQLVGGGHGDAAGRRRIEPRCVSPLGVVRLGRELQRRRQLPRQLGSAGAAAERERGQLVDGG